MLYITLFSLVIAAISAVMCGIAYGVKVFKSKKKKTDKPRPDFCFGVPAIILAAVFTVTMMISAIAGVNAETKIVSETKYIIASDETGNPIITNYMEIRDIWSWSEAIKVRIDVLDNNTKTFKALDLSDRNNMQFTESSGAYYVIQKREYENIWMSRFAIEPPDDECFLYLPESAIKLIGKQAGIE